MCSAIQQTGKAHAIYTANRSCTRCVQSTHAPNWDNLVRLCRACSERPGRNRREVKQGKSQQKKRTRLPRLRVVKDWDGAQRLWSPQRWRQVRRDWRQPHATCSEAARLRAGLDHAVCNHPCSAGAALGPSNDRVRQRLLQRVCGTARSARAQEMLPQIASVQYAAALAPNSR